jgi:hypothetical protein
MLETPTWLLGETKECLLKHLAILCFVNSEINAEQALVSGKAHTRTTHPAGSIRHLDQGTCAVESEGGTSEIAMLGENRPVFFCHVSYVFLLPLHCFLKA